MASARARRPGAQIYADTNELIGYTQIVRITCALVVSLEMTTSYQPSKYRPDIDGLRAVAVLSVIGFHAFPSWMPGGFVGVDVFFVISGFLISTILYEELEQGRFSFSAFYARRIRRIFPALLLVLLACLVLGWFALLASEYQQLGLHIAGGAGFVANYVSWSKADYFHQASDTLPLLHLWSLGIEEQFYLLWPLVLWLTWRIGWSPWVVAATLALLSFGLSVNGMGQDAVATFYSPQTRFWELLAGGLLAWWTLRRAAPAGQLGPGVSAVGTRDVRFGDTVSLLGMALLAYGFWGLDSRDPFPGAWALLPVSGAVLVILAGPQAWFNRYVLSNRLAIWVGLISYPLYLWHWPLLSFARIVEGEAPGPAVRAGAVVVSLLLAWLTYRYMERPIRSPTSHGRYVLVLVALMAAIGYAGYRTYADQGLPMGKKSLADQNAELLSQLEMPPRLLRNAHCEEFFPDYSDGLCVLSGNRTPDVLLFGDSHALQFYEGLVALGSAKTIGMLGGGWGGIHGVGLHPLLGTYAQESHPSYRRQKKILAIIASHPEIAEIVLACAWRYCGRPGVEDRLRATLQHLAPLGRRVTFVLDLPELPFDPRICLDSRPLRLSQKVRTPCAYPRSEHDATSQDYRRRVLGVLAEFPDVKVFDPATALCDGTYCYAIRDGRLLYRNEGENPHLSDDGSRYVAPYLADIVLK